MRISVSKHQSVSHASAPWLVVIPRRLSVSGKRQFRYFRTKAEALLFARSLRDLAVREGEHPLLLPGQEATEARAAAAILAGTGVSLVRAAWLVKELLSCGLPLSAMGMSSPAQSGGLPEENKQPGACVARIPTLQAVLKDMLSSKTHQSPHTQRSRANRFRAFLRRNDQIANTPIHLLTAVRIERALDAAWPNAPTSWNCMLTQLSTLFNYAVRKGMLRANPLMAIDRRHIREKEIHPVSPATLRALLLACRPPNAQELAAGSEVPRAHRQELAMDTTELVGYIAIAAFAGIRPTEITRLRWGDINLEDACLSVRRTASKTGGARHVEIHPTLHAWLALLQPHKQPQEALIFPASVTLTRRLRAVRRRAGFHAGNPWPQDALRHSYASYYLKAGGDINKLQLYMGHADSKLIYARYCNMSGLTRLMAEEWWGLTPTAVGYHRA